MAKRRLFAWALIITNVLVQMPGVPPADIAVASNAPQTLQNTWSSDPHALVPVSNKLATPFPILMPQRPMNSATVVRRVDPWAIAQRIAGVSYARHATRRHLSPQALAPIGTRTPATTSQSNVSRLGASPRTQILGMRTNSSAPMSPMTVTTGTADPDGTNHWWMYEEDTLSGVGNYMINVANGNLITQSDDMVIFGKGVGFAFRRTYNSMSSHTYANTDGSTPALYGDKWTNTFDIHIAYNDFAPVSGQKGVSLYDNDGARYDYAPVGDGHSFTPPAGQFAILYYDGTGYSWTKKSGSIDYFWDVNQPANQAALAGQIETIFGRNHNNYFTFTRSYTNGDASNATNLASMVVTAEDGRAATLSYGNVSQNGSPNYRVLQSLTWPDGTTQVTYAYTIQFQGSTPIGPTLTQVTNPGNSSTTSGKLNEQYNYSAGTALLTNVYSPRYYCSHNSDCNSSQNPILTGPAYTFSYGTGNVLSQVSYYGDVNPSITDASGTGYLQPSATHDLGSTTAYRTASLAYTTGSTTWSDTDGHQTVYSYDSVGRVTQTTETTGDPSGGVATLSTTAGWDSANNLILTTDPRTYETDYAYDNNGNVIEVASPTAPTNVNGTVVSMRSTTLYSFDANNNTTAYCDSVWVHQNNKDWTSRPAPSDSLCPAQSGTTILSWNVPGSYEPFGELSQTKKPLGFTSTFAYNAASQGGADYGLPTSVTGTSFTETDGTNITPLQTFVYDAHGNVVCYSNSVGTWIVQYDALNRRTAVGDPDDASLTSPSCSKTPGLSGSHIQTTTSYFPNGQVNSSQSPGEHAAGVSTTRAYDADGNEISETRHFGGNAGATTKLYDGDDRVVEVSPPHDSTVVNGVSIDYFPYPWATRNYYDLTQGGQPNLNSLTGQTLSVTAHGGLFAVGLWAGTYNGNGGVNSPAWWATKAYAYDALDRTVQRYTVVPAYQGTVPVYAETLSTYDTSSLPGLLVTTARMQLGASGGTTATVSYDTASRLASVTYSDTTPTETYAYDPDSRTVSVQSSQFGTLSYTYDGDGRKVTEGEPSSGGLTSAATYTYHYYANGWRQSIDVASSGLTQTGLFVGSYRADSRVKKEKFTYASNTSTFSSTYTPGGRSLTMTDPFYAPAQQYSYDVAGRLSSYTVPSGTLSGYAYDPEDGPTSFKTPQNQQISTSYDVRSELYNTNTTIPGLFQSADGVRVTPSGTLGAVPDAVTDAIAATFDPTTQSWVSNDQYDGLGRLPSVTFKATEYHGTSNWQVTGTDNRSYDAEDHLTSSRYTTWPCPNGPGSIVPIGWNGKTVSLGYGWGPNGHPVSTSETYPSGSYSETLHWIGDTLLFTTNASGQVDDIKVGALAEIAPRSATYAGLTVLDRDQSGRLIGAHNSTGYGSWESVSIFPTPTTSSTTNGGTCDNADGETIWGFPPQVEMQRSVGFKAAVPPVIYEPTVDVVSDGHSSIHGVREVTGATGTWSTADAFDGFADDPMSQRPYMLNNNNPLNYSDPSGSSDIEIGGYQDTPPPGGFWEPAPGVFIHPPHVSVDFSNLRPGGVVEGADVDPSTVQELIWGGFFTESSIIIVIAIQPAEAAAEAGVGGIGEISEGAQAAANESARLPEGSFSVRDWSGYPEGVPQPAGPFRLIQDSEYNAARSAANNANRALRRTDPGAFAGRQVHEIHPVKFGGSPTNLGNKIPLSPQLHYQVTTWWNAVMRSVSQ
jgi:YD repeat-containing protein